MPEPDDISLLRQYTEENSEAAFAALVERHISKVYSVALRHTRNPHQAEEITQAVFVILAKKARSLGKGVVLSGWLYQAARLTAVTFLRSEIRRARREQEAHMQNILNETAFDETWKQMGPLLDAAMARLNDADRNAVVLRFFDGKSMGEVGTALGASEEAAKKRVNRALEKLRKFFTKRGVVSTTAIIATVISANSVQAAPTALAQTISAVALAKGAASSISTLTLVKGALKVMAWTKTQMAVAVGIGIIVAAGTTTVVVKHVANAAPHVSDSFFLDNSKLFSLPNNLLILRRSHFAAQQGPLVAVQGESLGARQCRMVGTAVSFRDLIGMAYLMSGARTIFPPNAPQGKFDFLITLPASSQEQQAKRLQDEITRQFGLIGHEETIETNVLLLQVAYPNAQGIERHTGNSSSWNSKAGKLIAQGQSIGLIASLAEHALNEPVNDDTGLNGLYDFVMDQNLFSGNGSHEDIVKNALLDQFGLDLVPTNMPIKMLVVEKAN